MQENDVFHAIAHPARRGMLLALKAGERSAGALAEPFDMSLPAVSQHLRVLEEAELVSARRDGRTRMYSLQPDALRDVSDWISEFASFFDARLDDLGKYLDRKHGSRKR